MNVHTEKGKYGFKKINSEDLERVLKTHKRWALSTFSRGQKAELSGTDLKGHDLTRKELRWANLSNCDLFNVDFTNSNLSSADLSQSHIFGTNFENANLKNAIFVGTRFGYGTSFDGADLRDANFDKSSGLSWQDFAQKDIRGTKLPENLSEFSAVKQIEEISKNARNTFYVLLSACLYILISVIAVDHLEIFLGNGLNLPVISLNLGINHFSIFSLLIIISLYIHLQINLQRMWEAMVMLPSIFPDGYRVDEKIYPWIAVGIARYHFPMLKKLRPPLSSFQRVISFLLLFVFPPTTSISIVYLASLTGDLLELSLTCLLSIIMFSLSIYFSFYMKETLSSKFISRIPEDLSKNEITSPRPKFINIFRMPYFYICIALLLLPSSWMIYKTFNICSYFSVTCNIGFLDVRYREVSTKSSNWDPSTNKVSNVVGHTFFDRNLDQVRANGAFLAFSEFVNVNLSNADFSGANLKGTVFKEVSLDGANFDKADVTDADFSGVTMMHPELLRNACGLNTLTPPNVSTPPKKCD